MDGSLAAAGQGLGFRDAPDYRPGWQGLQRLGDPASRVADRAVTTVSQKVKEIHQEELRAGFGEVYSPYTLERKYPNAGREWGWP